MAASIRGFKIKLIIFMTNIQLTLYFDRYATRGADSSQHMVETAKKAWKKSRALNQCLNLRDIKNKHEINADNVSPSELCSQTEHSTSKRQQGPIEPKTRDWTRERTISSGWIPTADWCSRNSHMAIATDKSKQNKLGQSEGRIPTPRRFVVLRWHHDHQGTTLDPFW